MADWDPGHYLRFADHRTRPGIELIARIPDFDPKTIVDLGCGTGHLTELLRRRWPHAATIGVDSSQEMIDRAHNDHPEIDWIVADVDRWRTQDPVDLIFSNAALHWLGDHETLFPRLVSQLSSGGVIAIQMPDNWGEPTHRIPAEILDSGDYPESASNALMRDRVAPPLEYREWMLPLEVDMWRTTYYQQLTGDDPVWNWVTGSVLRPVLAHLNGDDRKRFETECRARYREAYPDRSGVTILPFSRLFLVGTNPS